MALPRIARRATVEVLRVAEGELDEWRQPTTAAASVGTFRGDVQPRRSREVPQAGGAGPSIVDAVVLAPPGTELYGGDVLRLVPDDGRRWRLVGNGRLVGAITRLAHVEADATDVGRSGP